MAQRSDERFNDAEMAQLYGTEEDFKANFLLPLLRKCGISDHQLKFERTLPLKLGKHPWDLEPRAKAGRLDILAILNGRNLFVIEVKRPSHSLTDQDKEQAILYARLLDQMAPIAVVTNGRETRFYDAITKEEITDVAQYSARTDKFQIWELPQDIYTLRHDALKRFISLSPSNLRVFCTLQRDSRMASIKGSSKDGREYDPDLFVDRQDITSEFENFAASIRKCFTIIGESGTGKTNVICHLIETRQDVDLTLFFNGAELTTGLWDA